MPKRNASYYLAAALSLATLAVYLFSLRNDFVIWDDDQYVLENPFIRSLDRAFFTWAWTSFYAGNWHPLTWVSHALDYAVWGLDPLGHHLTNTLLHALNTYLVVILVYRLIAAGKPPLHPPLARGDMGGGALAGETDAHGMLIAAGATGLLFGLHPLHVESVAWISERKDLLCGLFYLLSIMAYLSYVRPQDGAHPSHTTAARSTRKRYLLSLAFFALALMSKPMAVSLPLVLLILDWHPLKRIDSFGSFRSACVEKLPFAALSLVASALTMTAQRTASLEEVSFATRALVAAHSLIAYLGKMAAPFHLFPFYPYPDKVTVFSAGYLFAALAVCGITIVCLALARRQRIWLAVWAYYCITLLPVLGIVTVGDQSMADRYTYLPSLGPFLVLGLGASWMGERVVELPQRGRFAVRASAAAAICLVLFLSGSTLRQIAHWRNGIDLWTYAIEKGPQPVPLAYYNRGLGFMRTGRYDRALSDYSTAIALDPSYVNAYANRGLAYKRTGSLDRAMSDYNAAIDLDPRHAIAYNSRGVLLAETGQLDRALSDFTRGLSLKPDYANAYINRGIALKEAGRIDEALEDLTAAITIDRGSAEAYNSRGAALHAAGLFDQAVQDYTRAIELEPAYQAYGNRGETFRRMGLADRAFADYNTALSLRPDFVPSYLGRGKLYLETGRQELAMRDFRKACELGSNTGCDALRTRAR